MFTLDEYNAAGREAVKAMQAAIAAFPNIKQFAAEYDAIVAWAIAREQQKTV